MKKLAPLALLSALLISLLLLGSCDQIGHVHIPKSKQENIVPATCQADGSYDEVIVCSDCGEEISRTSKTIDGGEHVPGNWKLIKEATCSEEGSKEKSCTVCNELLETEVIPMLGEHTPKEPVKENVVSPTVTAEGSYDSVVYCAVCNSELSREKKTTEKLVSLSLHSSTLTASGDSLTGTVSNATESFDFRADVTVSDGVEWCVSTDEYGMNKIPTKTVPLREGDNTFYVVTSRGEDSKVYTVRIHRNRMFKLTFIAHSSAAPAERHVEEGKRAERPADPIRQGYDFDGWDYDFTRPISEDKTVRGRWKPKNDTPYKIEYYRQNDDGSFSLFSFENKVGTTDSAVSAPAISIICRVFNPLIGNPSGSIAPDGSLVLRAYYEINPMSHEDENRDKKCDKCGATLRCQNHMDDDCDTYCDTCGEYYDSWDEIIVEWDTTDIIFSLSENSNAAELLSTCKRYMAGEDERYKEYIDDCVANRNAAAYEKTKVNVIYDYSYTDDSRYGWGKCIELILTKVKSGDDDAPDIYCNFVYDMVSVSLKGGFANLYSRSRLSLGTDEVGLNYFGFAEAPDLYPDTGSGYMLEYMKSLSLSKHKMYCVASDYFMDTVRGFYVVPVNVYLMNSIEPSFNEGEFNSDRNGDGDFTIDDFYQLVYDGDWNYETLAQFSQYITSDSGEDTATTTLDDVVGFALSSSNRSAASGMLYSNQIYIIRREWSDSIIDFTFHYPDINEVQGQADISELISIANSMNNLFGKTGVIAVNNQDEDVAKYTDNGLSLSAIRRRFAENTVLFGSVVCLGSLELEEYQDMKNGANSGFGVAPVPLYRTQEQAISLTGTEDKYVTAIHSTARIGAISSNTVKFAQCSAFLDYVSTKRTDTSKVKDSTDILHDYYHMKLQYDIFDGSAGNIEMLHFIRSNVRSNFDYVYEEAIGRFFVSLDEDASDIKWDCMLLEAEYRLTDMYIKYRDIYELKSSWLTYLWNDFPSLPD